MRNAARARDDDLVRRLADEDVPLETINRLLQLANLPVALSIDSGEEIQASRPGLTPYTMQEMSDGERSAVLIAADILTAEPGKLFLIDEPERHLHRSIITPLLRSLISARRDCAFVIATHEIGLPLDFPESKALLLRGCQFIDGRAVSWHADLLEPGHTLGEQLQRDVLGARRKILFVEGKAAVSLDQPLYSLLFPSLSVVPKNNQSEVMRSVKGLRAAKDLAWVEAFGIVDRDNRGDAEVATLRADGVFALDWYSVESIYYHPEIQRRVAERRVQVLGGDVAAGLESAREEALKRIQQHADHLLMKRTSERARRAAQKGIPTKVDPGEVLELGTVDVPALHSQERDRLETLLDRANLVALVEGYPIREAGALRAIANSLGFQSTDDYERAVLKLLSDDEEAIKWARSQFGSLASAIAEPDRDPA